MESIASQIRKWTQARRDKVSAQYAPYFRGMQMLIEGEKKRKQDFATYEALTGQMKSLYPNFEVPKYTQDMDMGIFQSELKTKQQELELEMQEKFLGITPEEGIGLAQRYFNIEQEKGLGEEVEQPLSELPKVSTEPFTKAEMPERPEWSGYFSTKLTTAQKNKLDLIYEQGHTIYPEKVAKTINFYDREIAELETKEKVREEINIEIDDVKTGLSRFKVKMGEDGKVAKMSVMFGGSWKKINKSSLKKAQTDEYDSKLNDVYKYIDEYLSLKEREIKLEAPSPLDVETGLGDKYIIPEEKPEEELISTEKKITHSRTLDELLGEIQ